MNGRDYAFLDLAALPAVGSALLAPRPTLLFQADGRRILFANAAGAAFFGERRMEALLDRAFSDALPATEQIARAARSLAPGASRLERIRFAGSAGFSSVAAECVRLTLPGGEPAVLVRLPEPRGAGDTHDAAHRLVDLLAAEDCLVAVLDANGATMTDSGDFDVFVGESAITDLVSASTLVPGRPLKRAIRIGDSRRPAGLAAVETAGGLVHLLVVGPAERVEWEGDETLPLTEAQTVAPVEADVSEPASSPDHGVAESPAAEPESAAASDEPAEPVPDPAQAAEPEPLEAAVVEGFVFVEPAGPVRFVFQMDEAGRFTFVSPNFAEIVGPAAAIAVGESWGEMAARLGLDPTGAVASLIARRDTWSGVSLDWPVEGTNRLIAVDFAALPAFSRERLFEGYRGFGVIRPMERREPATVSPPRPALPSASVPPSAGPSNVIRLARAAPEQERLSPPEQDAFRRIAAALGGTPSSRPAAEPSAATASGPVADTTAAIEATPPVEEIAGGEVAATGRVAPEIAAEAHQEEQLVPAEPAPVTPVPEAKSEPVAEPAATEIQPEAAPVADPALGSAAAQDGTLTIADAEDQPAPELMPPAEAPDAPFAEPLAEAAPDLVPDQDRRPIATSVSKPEPESAHFISPDSALLPLMRRAETELVGARQRIVELEAILDTATDGIIVVDEDARIERINRSAEALFGVESASVTGLRLPDLLAEESRQSALDYLDGLARNGVASVLNDGREVIGRVPQGGLIPLFMTMGRLPETGKFCAVLRDITQWKNAEGELINAKRAAESASMQKSDFLAKVSHEIRTPLNAIIGFSEVMMEERFGPIGTERYKEYLRDIHVSGAHLMSLLNDLLDLSKIEAGKLDLTFEAVALNEIVMECVALMQLQANRERIIIRTSLSGQVPNIVADPRSIRQIVLNLVSNAVKFTLAGGQVIVSTAMEPHGEVTLRIRDTGIGMSEKDIETALKPFRQLSSSRERRSDGTGLGLPLTKALVEANRAAFAIDSSVGQGTLIRITFPATRVLAG
ncbi:PAS domain S-box protein [Mesorhizobium sp. BR1-1-16]|uniref:ATP-binding protein n=1 Tax=Mesorhizobium sp. BR1-1-16 TaxID=2876653 RepID=UPI001CCF8CF0|nr:ATP-binding protein [Mesorhizobium sp. BR1-1-16]MBZ9934677.1 PAS domain S-box protein [Mesorhizobium sp. BR1-1-16]